MKLNHRRRHSVLTHLAVVAGLGLLTCGPGWQFSKASAFPKPEPVYSDIPGLTSPLPGPVTNPPPAATPNPIAKWHLDGIWDQTTGKLAIINKRVYRIGDEIEGYKIIRIEGQEVWFQGPKRKERLALEQRVSTFPPPAPLPPTTVPQ